LSGDVGHSGRLSITWAKEYGDLGFEQVERWLGIDGFPEKVGLRRLCGG